ncbi:MFS transporter [Nonomuraea polychroma]|uniref:MFS transporter n=1 Tax=Nonomuraea polychroma TaxID=46176 RepID=UPI003D8B548E
MKEFALSLLKHRDARRLWSASACISAAVWMLQTAVAVHVLDRGSPSTLAMVILAGSVPMLLIMPIAGTVADRFDVRRVALIAMTAQTLCVAAMAAAVHAGLVVLAGLYALHGTALAFWAPLRQQWLYAVLPRELRPRANAALGSLNGLMTVIGAAGGGVLSAYAPVWAIGTASLLLGLGLAQLIRVAPAAPANSQQKGSGTHAAITGTFRDLRDGLAVARGLPLARSVIWIGIAWGFIGGSYPVLLAGRVISDLHGDSVALGLAYTLDGLSVIVATVLAGRLSPTKHLRVWAIGYGVQGVGWAGFFLAPSLPAALACLVLMRIGSGYIIALDTTILLDSVPAHFRGRMTSVHTTTYTLMARLSLGAIGWLLTSVSLTAVGTATGALSLVCGGVWWWRVGRKSQHLYGKRSSSDREAIT